MIYIDNYDSHALSFAYVIRFQSLFCFRFASSSNCGTCFRFAELDITSKDSVMALKESLEREHNGVVHCIINNAGMAYKRDAPDPFPQQASVSISRCEITEKRRAKKTFSSTKRSRNFLMF